MTTAKKTPKTDPKPKAAIKPKAEPKPKKTSKVKKPAAPKPEPAEVEVLLVAAPEATPESTPDSVVAADIEAEVEAAVEEELVAEETAEQAEEVAEDAPQSENTSDDDEDEDNFTPQPRPPAKLERLQKILAAAGVASRRSAEGMIEQGRVQVNGKVVTELGTKADAGRDHIRVDGKLLQGAERLRYFILNKPKGFVTTVKDPEGRPTVMQFFDKMKERLYPVGRLDYMSEGLLVVTNDGELANKLTKASSGVEKTYLVKVAGQPTEAELDILRNGVAIERGRSGSPQTGLRLRGDKPGSTKVRTAPARIRQVRQGDNPWYEVVLIEGRNRELRKMFEEVGHFVEKIRRTGYGPLVLDQEPGNLRELEPIELERLRLASEGKLRTPKAKDLRRRNAADAGILPTVLPKPSGRPHTTKPFAQPPAAESSSEFRPKKFGAEKFGTARPTRTPFAKSSDRPSRPARAEGFTPSDRPTRPAGAPPANFGSTRPAGRSFEGRPPAGRSFDRPSSSSAARPAWKKDDRPTRPSPRFNAGADREDRPARPESPRPESDRPRSFSPRPSSAAGTGRTGGGRPFAAKPAWKKPERTGHTDRPAFQRPAAPRREPRDFDDDLGPIKPPNLRIEEITGPDRPTSSRPSTSRPSFSRPASSRPTSPRPSSAPRPYSDRSSSERPSAPRSYSARPSSERSGSARPSAPRSYSDRPSPAKPFRSEGGMARPYTPSSGKPRAGGARPSSKPGRPAGRSYGPPSGARSSSGPRAGSASRPSFGAKRPSAPRTEGASDYRPTQAKPYPSSTPRAERKAGPGWKPKPSFGGPKKPGGFKGKPSGAKRPSFRPGGKKRG
jgi:23S rRNA pseudouridine2605 synthase